MPFIQSRARMNRTILSNKPMEIKNLKLKIKNSQRDGFSLVELLVVITIIAILSVSAYVALGGQTIKAKNSRRAQDLSAIQSALEIYFIDNDNKYPEVLDDGNTTGDEFDLVPKYMPKMAIDPSGDNYVYGVSGNKKKYQLATTKELDDSYEAYIVGNSTVSLIGIDNAPTLYPTDAGMTYNGSAWVACSAGTPVTDGGACVPYEL